MTATAAANAAAAATATQTQTTVIKSSKEAAATIETTNNAEHVKANF